MIVGESRIRDGLRIYAIGDIHGCVKELRSLLALIDKDLKRNTVEAYRLIFLGDYVDRGPKNKDVIRELIKLDKSERDTVFLRGNHDEKFANFLSDPLDTGESFMRWGGATTIKDYGVSFRKGEGYRSISSKLEKKVPNTHQQFIARLEYYHVEGDYFFAHAGVNPLVDLEAQEPYDLMWIRAPFMQHEEPYDKVIVHGHTPVEKPDIKLNRIAVDTRCYQTGKLTALVLEKDTQRFLQTRK